MEKPLTLRHCKPLICGSHRAVYDVDGNEELLVKVMLPGPGHRHGRTRKLKEAIKGRLRYGRYRFLFREYSGYLRTRLGPCHGDRAPPVANLRGLVATDLGVGMLTEKIRGPDGQLADHLHTLHQSGQLQDHLPLLNEFARSLFEWEVIANDINPGNVVLGEREGRLQFVLVDGLGDSHLIPLRSWFRWANRRSLHKRLRRTAAYCGLHWSSKCRHFTVPGNEKTGTRRVRLWPLCVLVLLAYPLR